MNKLRRCFDIYDCAEAEAALLQQRILCKLRHIPDDKQQTITLWSDMSSVPFDNNGLLSFLVEPVAYSHGYYIFVELYIGKIDNHLGLHILLNFDGDKPPRTFLRAFFKKAEGSKSVKIERWDTEYLLFKSFALSHDINVKTIVESVLKVAQFTIDNFDKHSEC